MKDIRICYSKTNDAYKIQYRFMWWAWNDITNGYGNTRYFPTLEDAKLYIKENQLSKDWEVVKNEP